MNELVDEVTDLLQHLIRNRCVNDGSPESGGEARSVDVLASYLEGPGLHLERYEARPGRGNLVARIEGNDPTAPTLMLLAHTDVVPANEDRWKHDPFGGEVIEGEVWGRGAIDMLNLTASMAVALRTLANDSFRPAGTLVYAAVADEEALGTYGAEWLLEEQRDAVRADYVITETGGFRMPLGSASGPARLPVIAAEKGSYWCTIRVSGTPGHASQPLRTDNALVKAAEVVGRIAAYRPPADVHDVWRGFVDSMELEPELARTLLDPDRIGTWAEEHEDLGLAREVHACTHTTFAPTVVHGGVKTNVIPDAVEIQLDIRTLPGQSSADVHALLRDALGDLYDDESVEIVADSDDEATSSPVATSLWDAMSRVTDRLIPGATTVPYMSVGATDARFFRRAGIPAYGYGLFSERIPYDRFTAMFHGDDERIDQESLRLSSELWRELAREFLG